MDQGKPLIWVFQGLEWFFNGKMALIRGHEDGRRKGLAGSGDLPEKSLVVLDPAVKSLS